MEKHHQESIDKFLEIYKKDESFLTIILAGSIAHGFEASDSDIDILLIADPEEYKKRELSNKLAFSLWDICTYENGYIDCKVTDINSLKKTAEHGSDAARYAYKDCRILFSRIDGLSNLLKEITAFQVEQIDKRRNRFASQLLAWKWYFSEGIKKKNQYLIFLAIQKIVLFSCRLVLNENRMLYPYHKWMLEEVKKAAAKLDRFTNEINKLLEDHSVDRVNNFCSTVLEFLKIDEKNLDWPNFFLRDSEQNWIDYEPPVDDL